MAKTSRFAALIGLASPAAKKGAKGEGDQTDERKDGDDASAAAAAEVVDEDCDCEGDDCDCDDAEEETAEDGDDEKEKAAAAKAKAVAEGAKAERGRWSTVLASEAAAGKVIAAVTLLADTDLTADAITKALGAMGADSKPQGKNLRERMREERVDPPAANGGPDPKAGDPSKTPVANAILAAVESVRPSKAA